MTTGETLPNATHVHVGTVPDATIRDLAENGRLVVENFDAACIKQACYELRASKTFYQPPDDRRQEAADYILLKPKQITVIITMEKLALPADMLGRILTKGQLFSIGLLPVNTYADPGFEGRLGIVLCNISNDYIRVKPGEPIAKIEFTRLAQAVSKPYRGQHGYESSIWPIPKHMILTTAEVAAARKTGRIRDTSEELTASFGPVVAELHHKLRVFRLSLLGTFLAYALLTGILVAADSDIQTALWSVVLGVASNAVFAGCLAVWSWRSKSRNP